MLDTSYSPKIIHKYDVADFTKYYYNRIYFSENGIYEINNNIISGNTGLELNLMVSSKPIKISGGDGLFLLGDLKPYLGPNKPTITVSANTTTDYYYGNLGQGSGINSQAGYFN